MTQTSEAQALSSIGQHFAKEYYLRLVTRPAPEMAVLYSPVAHLTILSGTSEATQAARRAEGVESIIPLLQSLRFHSLQVKLDTIDAQPSPQFDTVVVLTTGKLGHRSFVQTFVVEASLDAGVWKCCARHDLLRFLDDEGVDAAGARAKPVRIEEAPAAAPAPKPEVVATPAPAAVPAATPAAAPAAAPAVQEAPAAASKPAPKESPAPKSAPKNAGNKKREDAKPKAAAASGSAAAAPATTPAAAPAPAAAAPAETPAPKQEGPKKWSGLFDSTQPPAQAKPQPAPSKPKRVAAAAPAAAPAAAAEADGKAPAETPDRRSRDKAADKTEAGSPRERKARVKEAPQPDPEDLDKYVFVRNVPKGATEAQIRELFAKFGQVVDIEIHRNKRYCFVQYPNADGPRAALSGSGRAAPQNRRLIIDDEVLSVEERKPAIGKNAGDKPAKGTEDADAGFRTRGGDKPKTERGGRGGRPQKGSSSASGSGAGEFRAPRGAKNSDEGARS